MKRVLFVDDEQHVLDGLRDLLRKQRKAWDMVFALGGQQALAACERGAFDVVITDMRMPGMDGVTLLEKVKERYPSTARIILSGYADQASVVRALPVTHQFLSKPCDADAIRTVVERVCGLQSRLQDDVVRSVIGNIDRLPSLPRTYWALSEAVARPDVDLQDLAQIVELDPAMAVKVLQIVNSCYFGLAQKQTSVQQAVTYLGTELLKALALSAHVFLPSSWPSVQGFSLNLLQEHAQLTGRIARRFLRDRNLATEAFTAALVHDIGKIVLAKSIPDRLGEVIRTCRETGRPDYQIEQELLGVTHAEVGAYLLGLWGLPLAIVEAVAYHHLPELAAPTDTLIALHVANALSHASPQSDPTVGGRLNLAFIEGTSFAAELPRWRMIAEEERKAGEGRSPS